MSAGEAPIVTRAAPLFDVRAVSKWFPVRSGALNRVTGRLKAVDRVTLRIDAGTIVGLVGESGSGKTTVGRLLVKLLEPSSGTIAFQGRDLGALTRRDLRWLRKNVQMLFQDPFLSLNPHKTILQTVAYPLRLHGLATRAELGPRVGDLLRRVGLDPDDVAIMYLGNVVEVAPREPLFREPAHPYTRALMSAIPEPDSDSGPREQIVLHGEIPSPMNPPAGCKFHTRCQSKIGAVCEAQEPARSAIASGHEVACHLFSTNGRRP
jgi:oligopeptide/dipeptide ABC transporter ATP-binding protein